MGAERGPLSGQPRRLALSRSVLLIKEHANGPPI